MFSVMNEYLSVYSYQPRVFVYWRSSNVIVGHLFRYRQNISGYSGKSNSKRVVPRIKISFHTVTVKTFKLAQQLQLTEPQSQLKDSDTHKCV